MPVLSNVTLFYRINELHLHQDGTLTVQLIRGLLYADNTSEALNTYDAVLTQQESMAIFMQSGNTELARRDDISNAVYAALVADGTISGDIT